ncbi:MAG: hypothetical protein CL763_03420 [Chloroflexi bacterium]|nr:hypothetical protein [Chloroflexota bacterium]|tara:strand:+ start:1028 stop:1351 length:324 start_codon:yes stop_codon:yes gene_type:complete
MPMELSLEEHLAIPYRLVMESFEDSDGEWRRRASYPELPGCTVIGDSVVSIIEELDHLRVIMIQEMLENGQPIPVPRPPLKSRQPILDQARLGFVKYLLEKGRLSED